MDLIKKKSIALNEATHTRLLKLIAQLQTRSGVNTTANQAINTLLDGWEELSKMAGEVEGEDSEGRFYTGFINSAFIEKYFRI